MRTVEGDAVIPLSSTAAIEMDFCFVCVSLCVKNANLEVLCFLFD